MSSPRAHSVSSELEIAEDGQPLKANTPLVNVDRLSDVSDSKSEEDAGGLFTVSNFIVALPNIIIPSLYGYEIGLVGVYATLYSFATNCELYQSHTSCETLSAAKCSWIYHPGSEAAPTAGYVCSWADRSTCNLRYTNEAACSADSACVWSYGAEVCGNQVGYKSILNGLFAGSMIIGAMIGSFGAGVLTKKLNYPLSFLVIGITSTVASALTHVSTGIFEYWLLFVARIILGFAMGWQAVAAPAYVSIFSPAKHQKTLGTLFQVFTAFGCFVGAVVGICLGNTIQYSADKNANLMGRMQGQVALTTLLSIMVMGLFFTTKRVSPRGDAAEEEETTLAEAEHSADSREPVAASGASLNRSYTTCDAVFLVVMGLIMACTLQLTGINAMMNYAPTIMSNLSLDPLVGNVIVMAWNSLTAFGVIPLTRWFSLRKLFLTTTLIGSVACLFLCGIPVYPGVTKNPKVKDGIAIAGIAIFIGAYEMGIGPCFFVLAGDLFPQSFRHIGASLTVMFQFIFNVIINICYPIATEGISGGPSGNPDKGQSIAFIFFGCIGLVTVTVEFFFLHPWDEAPAKAVSPDSAEDEVQLGAAAGSDRLPAYHREAQLA